jgi:hypothetical protein
MAISQKQRETVLTELKRGESLRKACEAADIPEPSSVIQATQSDDEFASHYARAREIGWSMHADRIRETAADPNIPADHKRIMVDTDKWMLSKMLPKIYGDRLNLEHSGKVQTEQALTDAELAAIAAKGK